MESTLHQPLPGLGAEEDAADAFLNSLAVPHAPDTNAFARGHSVQSMADFMQSNPGPGPGPAPTAASGVTTSAPMGASAHSGLAVSRVNELAQTQGYMLQYDITQTSDSPPAFMGKLEIVGADEVFVLDQSYPNKKEMKAALAAQAAEGRWTRGTGRYAKAPGAGGDGPDDKTNWMGRLQEYVQSLPPAARDMEWAETRLGETAFAATVALHPSQAPAPLGSATDAHPSKKAARMAAARAAMQHLASQGRCAPDGTLIKQPKASPAANAGISGVGASDAGASDAGVSDAGASLPAQVAALTQRLGLQPVAYALAPSRPPGGVSAAVVADSIYDCEARLSGGGGSGGQHVLHGAVGGPLRERSAEGQPLARVEKVFGQKNARVACAREVLGLLEREMEFRMAGMKG